jgi:hypothetical protein
VAVGAEKSQIGELIVAATSVNVVQFKRNGAAHPGCLLAMRANRLNDALFDEAMF